MEDGKSRDWRGAFSFLGDIMGDILSSAMTYSKLLDIEYQLVLGRKNKTLALSIYFDENQFFHLAGLQYLTDRATLLYGDRSYLFQKILSGSITREQIESSSFYSEIKERVDYLAYLETIMDSNKTIFKYNTKLDAFSSITADFLMKNEIQSRNIFTFLSQDKLNGKYFCRSFFPQEDKDYSEGQTTWTLLYKKKIQKTPELETVLYDRLKK
ncbi:MAG: hypothetical protein J6J00_01400 [Treponema sp.]|nr:hypothetical protein [Treponema sp.]